MNQILENIEKEIGFYNPEIFTRLDNEWKSLINYNNYYRWLWAAIKVLNPKCVVEIGRERGVSANIILDTLSSNSKLFTIDINSECKFLSESDDSRVVFLTMDSLEAIKFISTKIDFLFIDGEHTREQVEKEWELYRPSMNTNSIVVFDDIYFNDGMKDFWNSLLEEKYDISKWHETGFGVVFIND